MNFLKVIDNWCDGEIILKDTTFIGSVRYNYLDGVVNLKSRSDNIQTFRPDDLIGFVIYDVTLKRDRHFYSIPFEEYEGGTPVLSFSKF